jgi:hypothetical protein
MAWQEKRTIDDERTFWQSDPIPIAVGGTGWEWTILDGAWRRCNQETFP